MIPILYIIGILAVLYALALLILKYLTRALPFRDGLPNPSSLIFDSCGLVDVAQIFPRDGNLTAVDLKEQYVEAEAEMTAAHDPEIASRIRRQMAGCLTLGWPLDKAICQSAYSFMTGRCRCHTCRSLTQHTLPL